MSETEVLDILRELGGRASTSEIRRVALERGWSESRCQRIGGTLRRMARTGALQVDRKADRRCYVYQLPWKSSREPCEVSGGGRRVTTSPP